MLVNKFTAVDNYGTTATITSRLDLFSHLPIQIIVRFFLAASGITVDFLAFILISNFILSVHPYRRYTVFLRGSKRCDPNPENLSTCRRDSRPGKCCSRIDLVRALSVLHHFCNDLAMLLLSAVDSCRIPGNSGCPYLPHNIQLYAPSAICRTSGNNYFHGFRRSTQSLQFPVIQRTLRQLGRFASNPELSFTWYDATMLSQRIREEAKK